MIIKFAKNVRKISENPLLNCAKKSDPKLTWGKIFFYFLRQIFVFL